MDIRFEPGSPLVGAENVAPAVWLSRCVLAAEVEEDGCNRNNNHDHTDQVVAQQCTARLGHSTATSWGRNYNHMSLINHVE